MQIWSEFSWSYASNSIVTLYLVGPIVAFVFIWALYKRLGRKTTWIKFMISFSSVCGFIGLIILRHGDLSLTGYHQLPAYKQEWVRLAVVEKSSGNIVAYNLMIAELKPWPFSRYRVVEHPSKLLFRITLQPITKNPKVVPLEVEVAVQPRDGMSGEQLKDYILNSKRQETVALEFKKQVFDFLQHRFPQDEAMRLNPFDFSSIDRLHKLLSGELNSRLEFHEVADVWLSVR